MLRRLEEAQSRRCIRPIRELFAPFSHPVKETPIHEGAHAFSPLSFFFGGGAKVSTSWARRLRVNRGSGRRFGFEFAGDQSPKRAFAGARKALFCLRRAGQARGAGEPGAIGAHAACVAARRSAIVAPFWLVAFLGKVCKKR